MSPTYYLVCIVVSWMNDNRLSHILLFSLPHDLLQ